MRVMSHKHTIVLNTRMTLRDMLFQGFLLPQQL